MNNKKTSLALLIASAFALSGCLSDSYDYSGGNDGTGGGGDIDGGVELGLQIPLYHDDPKDYISPYVMHAVDSDGNPTIVDGNALPADSNINVEGDFADVKPLTVEVTQDKASLVFSANDAYDINKANLFNEEKNLGGSVQFYINTLSYDIGDPEDPNKVHLTIANGGKEYSADVTSAVIASAAENGTPQFIRVPLNCFVEDGLDLANVDMAFALKSEGAIKYEFSQARMANNSVSLTPANANIQGCYNNNNSEILTADTTTLIQNIKNEDGDWESNPVGEFQNVRVSNGSGITLTLNSSDIRLNGIEYPDPIQADKKSFLTFAIDKGDELKDMSTSRLDFSHYMLDGSLQMKFFVPGTSPDLPEHGDLELVLSFESPSAQTEGLPIEGDSYGNGYEVTFNLTEAGITKAELLDISIPVRDFFTNSNGAVNLNAIQYVELLKTRLQVNTGDDNPTNETLESFRYGIANIKLVKDQDTSR